MDMMECKTFSPSLLWQKLRPDAQAADGDAALDVDVGAGLQPHNVADMRAFLNLSGFLTELLPLLGPQLSKGYERYSRCCKHVMTPQAMVPCQLL